MNFYFEENRIKIEIILIFDAIREDKIKKLPPFWKIEKRIKFDVLEISY